MKALLKANGKALTVREVPVPLLENGFAVVYPRFFISKPEKKAAWSLRGMLSKLKRLLLGREGQTFERPVAGSYVGMIWKDAGLLRQGQLVYCAPSKFTFLAEAVVVPVAGLTPLVDTVDVKAELLSRSGVSVAPEIPFEDLARGVPSPAGPFIVTYPPSRPFSLEDFLARVDFSSVQAGSTRGLGMVGAGLYATRLVPIISDVSGVQWRGLAAASGPSAYALAKPYGFSFCTADARVVMNDRQTAGVFIITRPDLHAALAKDALSLGKYAFVEKPLAVNWRGLDMLEQVAPEARGRLMTGFNRRGTAALKKVRELLASHATPLTAQMTVNATRMARTHWTFTPAQGGGRLLTNVCHFVDALRFTVGAPIVGIEVKDLARPDEEPQNHMMLTLVFADGSTGTILYTPYGDRSEVKERIEIFGAGQVVVCEDYMVVRSAQDDGIQTFEFEGSDVGRGEWLKSFVDAVKSDVPTPHSWEEQMELARIMLWGYESLVTKKPVDGKSTRRISPSEMPVNS